jgi:translation initiation factor 2B subunit (eIF-2B alpha/beta/delta family)
MFWRPPSSNRGLPLASMPTTPSFPSRKTTQSLDSLINKVDEHITVIKSLSPSSFTLDNLYDELAVIIIIRALPHSFNDVVRTISVLDKFDKPSVIQSLRNMD